MSGRNLKIALAAFTVSFALLSYFGMQPPSDVGTLVSRIGTIVYFAFFLLSGQLAWNLFTASIPAATGTVEPLFDRTSVRVVARMFDPFKTRVERMFESPVRPAYSRLMRTSLHVATDSRADLRFHHGSVRS